MNRDDLARLVRRERDSLVRHLRAAREGDVAGVHRARVASRRLRELVPVVEAALDEAWPALRRDLRRVTRALGPVREIDVTRGVLAETWRGQEWPPSVLARADRTCADARDRRRREMFDCLARGNAVALPLVLSALAARVVAAGDGGRAAGLLASRVRRRARVLAGALGDVGTLYAAAPIHAVRVATKKFRYSLEIGRAAAGLDVGTALKDLKTVQDLLGGLNDRQIAQRWMQTTAAERGVGRPAIRVIDTAQAVLEAACRRRHARFLRLAEPLGHLADTVGRDAALGLLAHQPSRMRVGDGPPATNRRQAGAVDRS